MELWIRSQDGYTLEKVQALQICENPDGTWFFNSGLILGKYKTKERALKVLNEIQGLLVGYINEEAKRNQMNGILGTTYIKTCFYEMPKE